jgi:7-cyano-7-deazaguanine reductase
VTNTILSDLVKALSPRFVRISADWYVRGGIRTYVTAEHRKRGWKPAPCVHLAPLPATGSASAMPSSPDSGAR